LRFKGYTRWGDAFIRGGTLLHEISPMVVTSSIAMDFSLTTSSSLAATIDLYAPAFSIIVGRSTLMLVKHNRATTTMAPEEFPSMSVIDFSYGGDVLHSDGFLLDDFLIPSCNTLLCGGALLHNGKPNTGCYPTTKHRLFPCAGPEEDR
jgi:hypothetical protein